MDPVVAVGHVLVLPEVVLVAVIVVVVTGVNQVQAVILDDGRTGEATAGILGITGNQGDWQVFPVNEVLAADVPPVHRPPFGGIGVELVEDVVVALEEAEAIRIV